MRGQLPSSAHVRPRWTDALLSVHKQHVLLPSPPVWFWLSGPQTGGDVCSLRRRQLLFLPPLHLSTSPLICWRRWHLPQSGLNVCAPVGGSCPGRNFDGGGGLTRLLCECKWPHIRGLTAHLRVHVEIKEKSSPRSWSP